MKDNDQRRAKAALELAITKLGGTTLTATLCKVSPQAVSQWNIIPSGHVVDVARESGVDRKDLRPDLYDTE